MSLKNIVRAVPIAALLGATALISPLAAQEQKTITGGFDVGPGGFQGNFNPLAATGGFTWLNVYFEPLINYNADLTAIEGTLATEYSVNADKTEYTFKLARETWHDGKPFTSKDVKFTVDLAKNGETGTVFAARLNAISSVETPDERTAVIKLSRPDAGLLATLTKLMILPEHALSGMTPKELATSTWWATKPIGTGPFKFKQYVTDQYVELTADEDYRLGRPKVARVINRYFKNPAAAVAALRAGEIQFTYVEPDDVPALKDTKSFRVIEGQSFVANYVGFNQQVPLWKDVRVRQAIMHAIDRQAIIDSLYGGAATVANCGYVAKQLVPEGLNPYKYDPAKAKALLAEAGWDKINGSTPVG